MEPGARQQRWAAPGKWLLRLPGSRGSLRQPPVKTPPIHPILRRLRAVRRRLLLQGFVLVLANAMLAGAAVLVGVGAWRWWALGREPWDANLAAACGAAALVVATLRTVIGIPGLRRVADWTDRAAGTRDRFASALEFSKDEPLPMQALAVQECAGFAERANVRAWMRFRAPRQLRFLAVPLAALALLQWHAHTTIGQRRADEIAARAEVEGTAKQLEELARQTMKNAEDAKSDELKKLAEELQRRADLLRAEAVKPEDSQKAALRQIAELEKLVRELQRQPAASAELQELAKALEKNNAMKQVSDALKSGDLAKAAEELEKALRELAQRRDERTPEEVKQALDQALKHLAEQQKLSESMQQLAQQMQEGGAASETLQKIAQLLRQMQQRGQQPPAGQPGQPGQQGKPLTEQQLQQLLSALENMKFGDGKDDAKPGQQGDGMVTMQAFGDPKDGSDKPGGDPRLPSGQPGSERDTGTTDTPFGKDGVRGNDPRNKQLSGRLGDGETLRQFLPTAGDASRSTQRYRDLYEAMAPAAEEAVLQENIPLGSRFFIKRYFESIRPKE
jgi:hypothetical protein